MGQLQAMFCNVVWARGEIETVMAWLLLHAEEHQDPMDCDAWCLPLAVQNFVDELTDDPAHLAIIFMVLLKDHFWASYANLPASNSEG